MGFALGGGSNLLLLNKELQDGNISLLTLRKHLMRAGNSLKRAEFLAASLGARYFEL